MPDLPATPAADPIVGIDLGTTNSLVGAMDAGFPVLIADGDGRRLTPSVVYYPPEDTPAVGDAAAGPTRPAPGTHGLLRQAAHGHADG